MSEGVVQPLRAADEAPVAAEQPAVQRAGGVRLRRVKISGLGQVGKPWTVEANGPIVLTTIELFGADRCLFASNYPVEGVCASFDTIFDGFKQITAGLPEEDRRKLFRDNAMREYRIRL